MECIASKKVWDPDTCQCHCPLHTIQPCSTGYMFDFTYSCSCVLIIVEANPGFIAGIILLCFLSVAIIVTLSVSPVSPDHSNYIFSFRVIMHKQRTGLFKESYYNSQIGGVTSDSKRTVLMSQESKYEYENAIRDTEVTLYQFDQRDNPSKAVENL